MARLLQNSVLLAPAMANSTLHDLALDSSGNVYVVDIGNHRIQVFAGDIQTETME
jgi:hypothetical protein